MTMAAWALRVQRKSGVGLSMCAAALAEGAAAGGNSSPQLRIWCTAHLEALACCGTELIADVAPGCGRHACLHVAQGMRQIKTPLVLNAMAPCTAHCIPYHLGKPIGNAGGAMAVGRALGTE